MVDCLAISWQGSNLAYLALHKPVGPDLLQIDCDRRLLTTILYLRLKGLKRRRLIQWAVSVFCFDGRDMDKANAVGLLERSVST
jgi:hypothetical protein